MPAIFADTSSPERLADALADEAGDVEVVELYSESLGEPGSAADTYLEHDAHGRRADRRRRGRSLGTMADDRLAHRGVRAGVHAAGAAGRAAGRRRHRRWSAPGWCCAA